MSNISIFLKSNKTLKENVKYAATKSLCDKDGNPLEWEIKPVSTRENNAIQDACLMDVQVPGKPGQYRQRLNTSKYMVKLAAASVAFPDLLNAELQNSYGVMSPEDLIQEMIDDGGEWNAFIEFIHNFNGFIPIQKDIDDAKN